MSNRQNQQIWNSPAAASYLTQPIHAPTSIQYTVSHLLTTISVVTAGIQ
jgi:hypothetical protein